MISTHEQILEKGQLYVGCRFPAKEDYRMQLCHFGLLIGQALAAYGARERFSVDFVCLPNGSSLNNNEDDNNAASSPHVEKKKKKWEVYAIEINLRSGGTTHPFETARLISDGYLDPHDGLLKVTVANSLESREEPRYYQASDNVIGARLVGKPLSEVCELLDSAGLGWNSQQKEGCLFYFTGALGSFGKLGMLSLASSPERATRQFNSAAELLKQQL